MIILAVSHGLGVEENKYTVRTHSGEMALKARREEQRNAKACACLNDKGNQNLKHLSINYMTSLEKSAFKA